jgi:peptidyl-prolyl cis-trans isomerase SurA
VRRLLIACLVSCASTARADVVECVVAFVDDEPIFLSELRERAERISPDGPDSPAAPRLYRDLLERLVDERLIAREAERLGVEVSPEQLAEAIEQVRAQNGLDEAGLDEAIADQGFTPAAYEEEVRRQLLRHAVLGRLARVAPVTDAEVRRVFEERHREPRSEPRYRLSHVSFLFGGEGRPDRAAARARAAVVYAELQRGSIRLEAAIARDGGSQTYWVDEGALAEAIRGSVRRTAPGQMTGVIESGGSFLVVFVHERESTEPPTYEAEAPAIRAELERVRFEAATEAEMRTLRENAYVVRRSPAAE